jgi:hypothetical protein
MNGGHTCASYLHGHGWTAGRHANDALMGLTCNRDGGLMLEGHRADRARAQCTGVDIWMGEQKSPASCSSMHSRADGHWWTAGGCAGDALMGHTHDRDVGRTLNGHGAGRARVQWMAVARLWKYGQMSK